MSAASALGTDNATTVTIELVLTGPRLLLRVGFLDQYPWFNDTGPEFSLIVIPTPGFIVVDLANPFLIQPFFYLL